MPENGRSHSDPIFCNLQYFPKRLVSDKSAELRALRALPITDTRLTCLRAYAPYPSLIHACAPTRLRAFTYQ